jgi:hypothetical protein
LGNDGCFIFEFVPPEASQGPDQEITIFHATELELGQTTKMILEEVAKQNPSRVVLDSLSELRLLAQSSLRYRRQILALKHFFARRRFNVLVLDDLSSHPDDIQLHSIAHGVISLEQLALDYGTERRRLRPLMFSFDEGLGTTFGRAEGLGIPLRDLVEAGRILCNRSIQQKCRQANSPPSFGGGGEARGQGRRDRQPERLPERHA